MPYASGRDLFMTPGPSVIPDRVLNAMHRAAPNIYEGPLVAMVDDIVGGLQKVARTDGWPSIYISNGHGVWEAALHNVLEPGQKILSLATGRFGHGFAETARKMGMTVEILDFGSTAAIDPQRVEAALRADTGGEIRAVTAVHTDTSTSIVSDIAALRGAIDASGHPALLLVDCIASLACDRFEMDAWGADVVVAGSQKGLMTPPGLAFTFHNEKAQAVSKTVSKKSPYWDWEPRINGTQAYQKFAGTPPTHLLFGLHEALRMILDEEGLENVWSRHNLQARAIWAAVGVWAEGGAIGFNVADPDIRSRAVTTLNSSTHSLTRLRKWCEKHGGLTLGIGIGSDGPGGDSMMRIGHMGHMNMSMLLGALATIEAGMQATGMPHGKGALEAAAAVYAGKG